MTKRIRSVLVLSLLMTSAAGCSQSKPAADMKPAPRPAELDHLAMFIGNWQTTGEMRPADAAEPVKVSQASTFEWACDKHCLLERFSMTVAEKGSMSGLSMVSWNARQRRFEGHWADSRGSSGDTISTFDPATRTWSMRWKGTDPLSGKPVYGRGTLKIPDDNTMVYEWNQWNNKLMWGAPAVTMKGTSKRS